MKLFFIFVIIALLVYLGFRQRKMTLGSRDAGRMMKMLDRCKTLPDAFFSGNGDASITNAIKHCHHCPDHKACDTYFESQGEDCPEFCPNREKFIAKSR